jgi:hypothetical protein
VKGDKMALEEMMKRLTEECGKLNANIDRLLFFVKVAVILYGGNSILDKFF